MAGAAVYYAVVSFHWRLTADATIMHYVNFLLRHGLKPYTDITDNNMPGAYYTEGIAMRIFGAGDTSWRIYDYFLLTMMTAALVVIARTHDWMAGVFAAGLFIIMHGPEGPSFLVEREQVIMVALLVAYATMFTAVRRNLPMLMVVFGIACGLAASIKPTFLPLPFVLLALMAVVLRRRNTPILHFLVWALLGFVAVFALDLAFLLHYHVLKPFIFILRTVSPTYASEARRGPKAMIALLLPRNMRLLPFFLVATTLAMWKRHAVWTWEQWAIALGVIFGLLSFWVQGKGFLHHRYTYLILLFLLVGYELLDALRQRGLPRAFSFATFAFILLWIVPQDLRATRPPTQTQDILQVDLLRLGETETLQNKIQCFDMVYGCFGALYHLQIVENTGFTGDLLFYNESDGLAARYYKQMFWKLAQQDPATVLVMSNEWFGKPNSFHKIDAWPQFAAYLSKNYTLVAEHRFSMEAQEDNPNKFRLYIRNGTPLLIQAKSLAQSGQL